MPQRLLTHTFGRWHSGEFQNGTTAAASAGRISRARPQFGRSRRVREVLGRFDDLQTSPFLSHRSRLSSFLRSIPAERRAVAAETNLSSTPVEYRGIRYTLRAGIERGQWSVAIYPAGVEMKGMVIIGSRKHAELQARAMIRNWLKRHSAGKSKLN
jgi:hypothetical protein